MMALKKQRGNMYEFVTHMWGPINGHCLHHCSYCYMNQDRQPPLHLDEKDLGTNLGSGKFIFVGHTCDMFAENVKKCWIWRVLNQCNTYPMNKYLFQSKNPRRICDFTNELPPCIVLATTIETNRDIVKSKAPSVKSRAYWLEILGRQLNCETMITIEPIFDFDLEEMLVLIRIAKPDWINIGADSKGHKLPEPPVEKIRDLIEALKKNTDVKLKPNLKRIYTESQK